VTRVVIGVDPASGKKGSYVFAPYGPDDFHDRYLQPKELGELVLEAKAAGALVCWDAPLTAAPTAWFAGEERWRTSSFLTQRPLERVRAWDNAVDGKINPFEAAGVSLLGYAGLSHWTISQAALDLPAVPSVVRDVSARTRGILELVTGSERPTNAAVVEVHPTVAAWLWTSEAGEWRQYKGRQNSKAISAKMAAAAVRQMWGWLTGSSGIGLPPELPDSSCADAFDARIAWLLGTRWLSGKGGEVEFVGNAECGGFLLPVSRLEPDQIVRQCHARGQRVDGPN